MRFRRGGSRPAHERRETPETKHLDRPPFEPVPVASPNDWVDAMQPEYTRQRAQSAAMVRPEQVRAVFVGFLRHLYEPHPSQ